MAFIEEENVKPRRPVPAIKKPAAAPEVDPLAKTQIGDSVAPKAPVVASNNGHARSAASFKGITQGAMLNMMEQSGNPDYANNHTVLPPKDQIDREFNRRNGVLNDPKSYTPAPSDRAFISENNAALAEDIDMTNKAMDKRNWQLPGSQPVGAVQEAPMASNKSILAGIYRQPPITPESVKPGSFNALRQKVAGMEGDAKAFDSAQRVQENRAAGVMHVSPDGTVEPPAGNLRTGQPAPKQQFGGEFGRVRGDRPLSAEAAAYEKERLGRPPLQPQQAPPITPQQESVVKSSAVTGGKMDKIKAGAGRIRNVASTAVGSLGPIAALAATAKTARETDTEDYYKRFGVGNGGIIPMPKNDGTITGDLLPNLGIRALGAASELGSNLTLGAADAVFQDKADPAQELADAGTNLAGGTGAAIASKLLKAAMKSKPGKIASGIASVIGGLTGYSAANAAQDAVAFHAGNESRPQVAQPAQQEQPSLAQEPAQQPVPAQAPVPAQQSIAQPVNTGQAKAAPTAESGAGFVADSKGNKAVWDPATQSFKGSLNNGGKQVAAGDGYTNDAGQYFAPGVYGGGLTPANRSSAILAGTTPQFAQGAAQERPQGGNVHIIRDSGGDAVSRMLRDPNVPDAVKVKLQLRQGMLENDNRRIDVNERAGNRAAAVDEARIASILQGAGIDQGIKAMELENAGNIRSLRNALNRETDPERRQQMADQLDVLLGQTGEFQVANIDTGEVDPDTLEPIKAAVLVDSRSGNVSRISAPPAQQKLVDKNGKELIKDPKTGQLMYAQ